MPAKLDQLVLNRQRVAIRAPAVPATGNIFIIVGGPVWIKGIFMHTAGAQAAGATIQMTVNGVAWDAGAFNFNVAAGGTVVFGPGVAPVAALNNPMPQVAVLATAWLGAVASADAAAATIAIVIAAFVPTGPASFHCIYYALAPDSRVVPA